MKYALHLLGMIALSTSAQAASFDCAKAVTNVEKLICSTAELSKLDEELNIAYQARLKEDRQDAALRQSQKKWIRDRNECSDPNCVKRAYEVRLSALTVPQDHDDGSNGEELIGSWEGGDTAAMSIYGTMAITKKTISWNKNHNFSKDCLLTYQIQKEESGVVFSDQAGHIYTIAPNSEFKTFFLKITSDNCNTGVSYFRLTFPKANELRYLAMNEYDRSGNENGRMHFHRRETK